MKATSRARAPIAATTTAVLLLILSAQTGSVPAIAGGGPILPAWSEIAYGGPRALAGPDGAPGISSFSPQEPAWEALGSGMDDVVYALATDSLGNLYAGGDFHTAGGVTVNHVAKWNGSAWSALSTGTDSTVYALTIDGSNNLYAGGSFVTAGGTTVNHVAKWERLSMVCPGVESLPARTAPSVRSRSIGCAEGLYAGGLFSIAGYSSDVNNLAVWYNSYWYPVGGGANGQVLALATNGDGNVYAGGEFTMVGDSTAASRVARWNGSSWSALGVGVDSTVDALAVDSLGTLYAGGNFVHAGGQPMTYLGKWDGSSWSGVDDSGLTGLVLAAAVDSSDDFYVGGFSQDCHGAVVNRICRWDGAVWLGFGGGVDSTVQAIAVDGAGTLYVGGWFSNAGLTPAAYVARSAQPLPPTPTATATHTPTKTPTQTATPTPTPTASPTPTTTPLPVSAAIPPGGGTLVSNDTGASTTIIFPEGAVTSTTVITYAYQAPSQAGNLMGIEHFFDLTANQGGQPVDHFLQPVTIAVRYTAEERGPVVAESLALYWLSGLTWVREGITTEQHIGAVLTSTLDHLTRFAVLGVTNRCYLPVVMRAW